MRRAARGPEAFFLSTDIPQGGIIMWKIAIGFVAFAAISLFVIMQAGDKVDMSGEKHGGDVTHAPATPAEPAAK
jgi:hypothetical protein